MTVWRVMTQKVMIIPKVTIKTNLLSLNCKDLLNLVTTIMTELSEKERGSLVIKLRL